MLSEEQVNFILEILKLTSIEVDENISISWRTDGEYAPVTFFADASDLFSWATADCEDILPVDLADLKQAIKDVKEIDKYSYDGQSLWVCRKRQMRPMDCAYPLNKKLWPLFDAAGPHRNDRWNTGPRPEPCKLDGCLTGQRARAKWGGYCSEFHQQYALSKITPISETTFDKFRKFFKL